MFNVLTWKQDFQQPATAFLGKMFGKMLSTHQVEKYDDK